MGFQDQHEVEADQFTALIEASHIDGLRAAKRRIDEEIERRGNDVPWRTMVMPDSWYQNLDEGIRFAVRVLHAAGLETCQSCQGGEGHDQYEPMIDVLNGGRDASGFAALAALVGHGIDVLSISDRWGVIQGLPTDRVWRITLRRAYPERANEKPGFIRGYIAQGS